MAPASWLAAALWALPGPVHADAGDGPGADGARLVTLGGAVTEIVRALGAGDQVVGIDATSANIELPGEPKEVGFFRRASIPGILSLKPTRVIALDESGPANLWSTLEQADVAVTRVENAITPEAAKKRIRTIAKALGRSERGDELVASIERDLKAVKTPADEPKVLFIYARGAGTLLVAGQNTNAASMIELAGGEQAVTAFEGFKPFSPEAVIAAAPDVLLMTDTGLRSLGGEAAIRSHEVLGRTPAVKNGHIVTLGDLELLGFGPSLGTAAQKLARALSEASDG
jgi:iron complex transport system substrate-binding protein